MGKLLKRAAGRHAYPRRASTAFIKRRRAQYVSFRMHARKLQRHSPPPFTRACISSTRVKGFRALVSPFQKISSFRAINFNLSRQSDAPKDCNMSPVMQKIRLHLLVTLYVCVLYLSENVLHAMGKQYLILFH